MNFNTENSLPENRVLQQGNGEGLPFNQNDPNVYFMVSDSIDNILKAYINNIWGSTPSKSNLTSFSKVNIGDYIVTYCSVTGGEDKDKQGFHTIGRVIGKRDSEYRDYFTWEKEYGCIVDVEWLNVPRKDRVLTLEEAQELWEFSKWRFCLCNGQYTNVADKGWNIHNTPFLLLKERLMNGFRKERSLSVPMEYLHKLLEYDIPFLVLNEEKPKVEEVKKPYSINLERKVLVYPERLIVEQKVEDGLTKEELKLRKRSERDNWKFYNPKNH
jgi:hypothetical protein